MLKTILPISIIIALRFLGLFIVLPVLSVYALELEGGSVMLAGACVGVYAISQMTMQVPFGAMSDKIGRKKTLFFGTLVFIVGSLICAEADNIYTLIFGRFVQGMGAVGAVGTALISDLVKEEMRAKAMAFMGAIIALSFAFSMTLGPLIGGNLGVDKLFLLTAILGALSLLLLFSIPNPPSIKTAKKEQKVNYAKLLTDANLCRMNITNFLQKSMMTLAFMSIPIVMTQNFLWEKSELWKIYAPAMIFGLLAMAPSVIIGEKKRKSKEMLCVGILFFIIAYFFMGQTKNEILFAVGVALFFIGFNIHEPLMQSLTSKYAKAAERGATLGVFNFFGYFGTFLGGLVGGVLHYEMTHIFWAVFAVCIVWLPLMITLKNPFLTQNLYIAIESINTSYAQYLNDKKGIIEWYESRDTLVVKFDTKIVSKSELEAGLRAS